MVLTLNRSTNGQRCYESMSRGCQGIHYDSCFCQSCMGHSDLIRIKQPNQIVCDWCHEHPPKPEDLTNK